MKQCPNCRTTYTDETLSFCLHDGTRLEAASVEQPTQVRRGGSVLADETVAFGNREKLRIDLAGEQTQTVAKPGSTPAKSGSGLIKITVVAGVLLLLAVLGAGAVGVIIYFASQQSGNLAVNNAPGTPLPAASPRTAANDAEKLRDQIANLQRQLDEQKKEKGGRTVPLTHPETSRTFTTARANSPRDGFLALRSLPNTEIGDRLAKIPHGATVSIGACGPEMRSGTRSGRWCQASYNGMSGWVFDAYLSY